MGKPSQRGPNTFLFPFLTCCQKGTCEKLFLLCPTELPEAYLGREQAAPPRIPQGLKGSTFAQSRSLCQRPPTKTFWKAAGACHVPNYSDEPRQHPHLKVCIPSLSVAIALHSFSTI